MPNDFYDSDKDYNEKVRQWVFKKMKGNGTRPDDSEQKVDQESNLGTMINNRIKQRLSQ